MVKQYYSNELYHHGVKGQKWGIRKFRPINNRPNISRNQYNDTSERKRLSSGVKKALIVGGVIAGSIAVDLAISKFNKRMVLSLASASK